MSGRRRAYPVRGKLASGLRLRGKKYSRFTLEIQFVMDL